MSGSAIQFNTGDTSKTISITINQDSICEEGSIEYFYSTLCLESDSDGIIVSQSRAIITINDTLEEECSKCFTAYL